MEHIKRRNLIKRILYTTQLILSLSFIYNIYIIKATRWTLNLRSSIWSCLEVGYRVVYAFRIHQKAKCHMYEAMC